MKLSQANPTTSQANLRHTFELPPTAFAICSTQPSNVADAAAAGYRFDVRNLADDLEVHLQGIKSNAMATFKVEYAPTTASTVLLRVIVPCGTAKGLVRMDEFVLRAHRVDTPDYRG